MKKLFLWLVILTLSVSLLGMLSLAGCKEEAVSSGEADEETAEETTGETTTEEAGEKTKIVFWLGGEWDVPNLSVSITEIADQYMIENPNIELEIVSLSFNTYMEQAETAGQAGAGPDSIFTWPAVFCFDYVWKGYLAPVDEYIPEEESAHYIGYDVMGKFDGKHWRVPYYMGGHPFYFNKALFEEAGLEPVLPQTWDELLVVCEKLKEAGITPLATGVSDWGGGNMTGRLGAQTLDSPLPWMLMALGEDGRSMTDPEFSTYWERIYDLYSMGYYNEDASSLTLTQSWELLSKGEVAMAHFPESMAAMAAEAIGPENLGAGAFPKFADGAMAGRYVNEVQGGSITAWSEVKQETADFLMYLHTPYAMEKLYNDTGAIQADDRFDKSMLVYQAQIDVWDLMEEKGTAPFMEEYIPFAIDEGAIAGSQLLFAGEMDGKGVAELCEEYAEKWRTSNPEMVENFKKWTEDFR